MSVENPSADASPWTTHGVDAPSARWIRVGALELWIRRGEAERSQWWIGLRRTDDPLLEGWETAEVEPLDPPDAEVRRVVSRTSTAQGVRLVPRVADRAIIARPETTLSLRPGATARLYVTSPVWVEIHVDDEVLHSVPSWIPSNTWFGDNPIEGVLCYATRTRASPTPRMTAPGRVTTPVVIDNRSDTELRIERVGLPIPAMSIYGDEAGQLWTEVAAIDHRGTLDAVAATVEEGPPREARGAARLSEVRERAGANQLGRAFSNFLGGGQGA